MLIDPTGMSSELVLGDPTQKSSLGIWKFSLGGYYGGMVNEVTVSATKSYPPMLSGRENLLIERILNSNNQGRSQSSQIDHYDGWTNVGDVSSPAIQDVSPEEMARRNALFLAVVTAPVTITEVILLARGGAQLLSTARASFGKSAFESNLIGGHSALFGRARLGSFGGSANGLLNRYYVRIGWSYKNGVHYFQPRIGPKFGANHYKPWITYKP